MSTALDQRSIFLRKQVVKILEGARRGHLGPALSLIEILRVLYDDIMNYRPEEPDWHERDRCILSKGHGCLAQYVLLADKGFFDEAELMLTCSTEGILGGHPEYGKVPGIEASTGSLGHGLSIGLGFAMNAKLQGRKSRVFVIIGDGESNEGSIWEAAMSAAKNRLDNLTVILDYNKQQSYGAVTDVMDMEPLEQKWASFGFEVQSIDGHDVNALKSSLSQPIPQGKPGIVICHTVKGKGIDFAENNPAWHHQARITDESIQQMIDALEAGA